MAPSRPALPLPPRRARRDEGGRADPASTARRRDRRRRAGRRTASGCSSGARTPGRGRFRGDARVGGDAARGADREMEEEAGISGVVPGRMVGVFSAPQRDPRFHAVTVVVECKVQMPTAKPKNPVEILEVGAVLGRGVARARLGDERHDAGGAAGRGRRLSNEGEAPRDIVRARRRLLDGFTVVGVVSSLRSKLSRLSLSVSVLPSQESAPLPPAGRDDRELASRDPRRSSRPDARRARAPCASRAVSAPSTSGFDRASIRHRRDANRPAVDPQTASLAGASHGARAPPAGARRIVTPARAPRARSVARRVRSGARAVHRHRDDGASRRDGDRGVPRRARVLGS